jgi:hypothetical protein
VIPEDGVGADPALAVVDEGALVVGPKPDHASVKLDQVALAETLDLAVREGLPVTDDATQLALVWDHLRHGDR